MRNALIVVAAACSLACAQKVHVMFVGVEPGGESSFAKRYEQCVWDRLKAEEWVSMVDYAETRRLVEKIGLGAYPAVSESFIKSFRRYSPDSTLFVWGRVEEYSVEAKRKGIFRARVVGSVSLALSMYSLDAEKYLYAGTAAASTSVRKRCAWFRRADLVTQITARDRDVIATELAKLTSERTATIVVALIRSIFSQNTPGAAEEPQETEPSLYDVFEIPSAEPPPVEEQGEPAQESPLESPENEGAPVE